MSASNDIASFLEACGLSHLTSTFVENKIDDLALLQLLTNKELKELIPCMGDRKKIEIKLSQRPIQPVILSPEDLVMPLNTEILDLTETEQPLKKKPKVSLSDVDTASTLSNVSLVSESDIPSTSSNASLIKMIEVSNTNNKDMNNMINNVLNTYEVINFNLKDLLKSHIIGRAILLKFEKTKLIDNKDRNNLCDIIICHFLNENKRLNNSTVGILADKIVEIFHEERRSTYYVSPIGKSQSRHNKPEVARGKLIDKYRNKLTMLRKTLASCETFTVEEKENISREMQDSQVWLKHNSEPKNEVIRRWKLSFPIRKIGRLIIIE
ncbi:uncharacterized protein [Temnothorax nylanderi]|uniref:uncharacterized protein n=1 Tax=Temnothorax nylanderi TaxID=102681 RepID=UPI003A892DE1